MFALAACQEELQIPQQEGFPVIEGIDGELQQVTFLVSSPQDAQTKAISDGMKATNLQYAVYRAEDYTHEDEVTGQKTTYKAGEYIPALSQGDDPNAKFSNAQITEKHTADELKWEVVLTLAKNVKYDIVFWAYAEGAPYTFNEKDAQIIVDNYTTDANDETRDAFYFCCENYAVIESDTKVELRRPFAQINFGACDYIPYVTDLGLVVTSKIDTEDHEEVAAVYDTNNRLLYPERPAVDECTVPNTLNVLDGSVSGEAVVKFQLADIPFKGGDEVLLSAKTAEGETIPYHWMGMNYILAGAEATINNIHATFHYNGQDLVFDVPNVPYKRNYKTNIIGNLFTENAKFNVVVVPDYFTPDIVIDLDELEALNPIERAIKLAVDGKLTEASVVLSADLELEETITVPAGLKLVLDLGGKTLTSSVAPAFLANGNVTMSNGNAQVAGEFVRAGAGAEITLIGVKAVSGTETAAGDNCVFIPKDAAGAKVVIGKDTELKSYGAAAIQSNGHTEGLELTVAGKVESVGAVAMYLPQVATCTIEGTAVISGATGIELRAGDLVVKDGASISAGDDFKAEANGNGSTVLGAAVAVSAHSTNLPINVTIEGGVFSCKFALYEVNFFGEDRTAETKLSVKAGTFNAPIFSENCTGFITGGTFAEKVEVPAEYLAEGLIVGEDGVVKEKPAITVTAIKDVIPGDKEYTVEGVVVAVGVNGYVVADDAAIFVYGQNHGRKLNEKVQLTGVVSQKYKNNVMQFSSPAVTVLEETATYTYSPKSVDGSAIDAAVASGTATCEEVTFMGILSVSGEYVNITIDGGTKQGSLKYITASDYASLASKKVVVKGYVTSTYNYYSVLPYSVELAPKEYTDWYLMGINDDWGTGIQMEKYDNGDDYGVIYNLEVSANQNFKFKNAGDWFGYWDVLTPSTEYVAGVDGGNAMFISAGTYDVYFATDKSHYVVLPVGSALPSNPYELGWTWRIVGTNNGWQANETATPFVASGDVLVAKAVVFADAVSFKILERTHDWNYSLCINGNQPIIDGKPANLKVNGDNIVPTTNGSTGLPAGTYDLYLDPLARTLSIKSYVEAPAEPVIVFQETFAKCKGTMGWTGSVANGTFATDNANWKVANAYGADGAAKFGAGSKLGSAETPALSITGTATLKFKAGAWSGDATTLKLSMTNGTLSKATVTMQNGDWTEYEVTITNATEGAKIKFEGKQESKARFFLDDIVITQ